MESEYLALLRSVVEGNRFEIEQDLASAKKLREQADAALQGAERRLASLEFLLSLTNGTVTVVEQRTTLHEAMKEVLKGVPGRRMPATDIAREINRRGLYRMRDGRPVEPQQIHARAGNYGGFNRGDGGIGLD